MTLRNICQPIPNYLTSAAADALPPDTPPPAGVCEMLTCEPPPLFSQDLATNAGASALPPPPKRPAVAVSNPRDVVVIDGQGFLTTQAKYQNEVLRYHREGARQWLKWAHLTIEVACQREDHEREIGLRRREAMQKNHEGAVGASLSQPVQPPKTPFDIYKHKVSNVQEVLADSEVALLCFDSDEAEEIVAVRSAGGDFYLGRPTASGYDLWQVTEPSLRREIEEWARNNDIVWVASR